MSFFSRMPASSKFKVAKVARYLMPFVKPLTLGMIDLKDDTTKELLEAGLDFFGEETGEKIKDYLKTEPDAATGLIDEHLVRHTGQVLGTLVKRYAKEPSVKAQRADLLKLAKLTPEAWGEFLASDKLKMAPLRKDAYHRRLTIALDPQAAATALEPAAFVEFFRWLAVQKNLLGPLKPGLTPPLTKWIIKNLDAQLLIDLCKDTPEANAAYKDSVLRFLTAAHTEAAGAHREAKGAHQKSKTLLKETRKIGKKVDDALRNTSADARRSAYLRALLSAFSAYQELALDNYSGADQTCPDIWDIFVHPACAKDHLRPEDMDAAQRETPPRLPAQDLLPILGSDTERRHVLLADPGMGKSTLIQSLIAHLASGRPLVGAKALNGLLPVPLILRDLVPLLLQDQPESWTWDSLITVLLEQYQREETAPPLLEAYCDHTAEFRQLIHTDAKVFFLIDGLDEIGDRDKRQQIVRAIQEGFRMANKGARWLITSRVIGYEDAPVDIVTRRWPGQVPWATADLGMREFDCEWQDWLVSGTGWDENDRTSLEMREKEWTAQDENWRRLTGIETSYIRRLFIAHRLYLAPFDDKRQDAFTSRWFRHRHSTDHSKELMREVRAHHHDGVRIISRVPNLLCMMNMLKRSGKPLPDGRAALYDEIVKAYLGGIDAAYKFKPIHGHTCPFEASERRHLLALLGAHMQQIRLGRDEASSDGNILIAMPELVQLLLPAIEAMQQAGKVKSDHSAAAVLEELLHHIASRSGLLIPRSVDAEGNTVYGFTHLSFLEFFAAEWLGKEFDRLQKRLARRAEAMENEQTLTEADLDREFPAPRNIEHKRADFPILAASPAWHEPLIFLVESRKNDTATLLRWLFPALHASNREQRTENSEPAKPLMPLDAVRLATQLAHDQELVLSPETRRHWWRSLWTAYLEWPHSPLDAPRSIRWPIAPLLLERTEYRAEVLRCLVEAYQNLVKSQSQQQVTSLQLPECNQLTSADLQYLSELTDLRELYLIRCTGLEETAGLVGLKGLRKLYLDGCTGLKGREALSGLRGMFDLEELSLLGCTALVDTEELAGLQRLHTLNLNGCTGIQGINSLESLKGLGDLRELYLHGCGGLTEYEQWLLIEAVRKKHRTIGE